MEKTVKDVVVEKYGSINNFIAVKIKEYNGELPLSREYIYKLINHEIPNPGIKSLTFIAELVELPKEKVYKEYTE